MYSNTPSDPEEADAVHRRFLPPPVGMAAQHGASATGSGPGVGFSNGISKDDFDNENVIEKIEKQNTEKNFLLLKAENPDYGATTGGGGREGGVSFDAGEVDAPSKKPTVKEDVFGFDWSFLKRFYRLHGVLFMSVCSAATALFLFLLCMCLLYEYVGYQVGLIASGFYKTLGDRDLAGFWKHLSKAMALILAITFIRSTKLYVGKVLSVTFRKILCDAAHRLYFADIRFYQLNVLDKAIDNPDQRMTQDIDKFCTTYCEVLPKLLIAPFTIGYYCYQGYQRSGWEGPVGCFGFFLFATAINKVLMSPIVNYTARQQKCEGDFRFLHMLVRVNSESIAFHQAAIVEQGKVDDALTKLLKTQHTLYLRQYFLSFFTDFVDYIGSIFSYLMLALPIFNGTYDALSPSDLGALISQNAFILIYLIYTFTNLVDLSGPISDLAGVTHRISQLFERLNALELFWKDIFPNGRGGHPSSGSYFDDWAEKRRSIGEKLAKFTPSVMQTEDYIQVDKDCFKADQSSRRLPVWSVNNITFAPPVAEGALISNLSFELIVGESVLISGTSSAGKTSILRILRGLWPYSDGTVKSFHPPGPHGVYFCPQKTYLTWGTLREQISFPLHPDATHLDDKLMLYYLDKLKLLPVLERVGGLDVFCSWTVYDSLSPGETQRLCLLRVFYHQPVVAVLDEVTSALPLDMEDFVYSELKRLGITLISVGHRESIRKYHDKQLIVDAKGGWTMYPIIHD